MALARTAPFREELERRFPQRPFDLEFWDGTSLPATEPNGGLRFTVRSPKAVAHALRAPGELGLGRAYVSGELQVDNLDAALDVLDTWQPPPLPRGDPARAAVGRAAPARPAPHAPARRRRRAPPLRRGQRVLRADARRVDDLQLRD